MIKTKSYFCFRQQASYDFGILAEQLPPIITPARRMDTFTAPGMHGTFHIDQGAYHSYTKTVACALFSDKYLTQIPLWLRGSGNVTFSSEPEYCYRAVVSQQMDFERVVYRFRRFKVKFECQPFRYRVDPGQDQQIFQGGTGSFDGTGNMPSEPVITVYGQGDITLRVNGVDYVLREVEDYITLNSEILEAYKGNENQNNKVSGHFPELLGDQHTNEISCLGDVERVEITPNWRWL